MGQPSAFLELEHPPEARPPQRAARVELEGIGLATGQRRGELWKGALEHSREREEAP